MLTLVVRWEGINCVTRWSFPLAGGLISVRKCMLHEHLTGLCRLYAVKGRGWLEGGHIDHIGHIDSSPCRRTDGGARPKLIPQKSKAWGKITTNIVFFFYIYFFKHFFLTLLPTLFVVTLLDPFCGHFLWMYIFYLLNFLKRFVAPIQNNIWTPINKNCKSMRLFVFLFPYFAPLNCQIVELAPP